MPAGSILVADDDAAIRTVLNQALSRAGYEVRSTGNAATLWRWVSQGEGDLVITDVVMPDENAFDLLPRIKKLRPNLPVLVMSAQNTFLTAIRASERGAYEYLPKPFDLNELVSVVNRALSAPAPSSSRVVRSTMLIDLHVSEINAAIALFSGVAEKIREQAIAQSTPPAPTPDPSIPDNAEIVPVEPK